MNLGGQLWNTVLDLASRIHPIRHTSHHIPHPFRFPEAKPIRGQENLSILSSPGSLKTT